MTATFLQVMPFVRLTATTLHIPDVHRVNSFGFPFPVIINYKRNKGNASFFRVNDF